MDSFLSGFDGNFLTYPTSEGSQEIRFDGEKLTFGRGSDADYRFEDDGLSRLHSTIYRDGERVWIVDENSTNGTLVNGEKVGASGTPLQNGDTVKIGHFTNLKIRFSEGENASKVITSILKLHRLPLQIQIKLRVFCRSSLPLLRFW